MATDPLLCLRLHHLPKYKFVTSGTINQQEKHRSHEGLVSFQIANFRFWASIYIEGKCPPHVSYTTKFGSSYSLKPVTSNSNGTDSKLPGLESGAGERESFLMLRMGQTSLMSSRDEVTSSSVAESIVLQLSLLIAVPIQTVQLSSLFSALWLHYEYKKLFLTLQE